jgi:hypothetical protein
MQILDSVQRNLGPSCGQLRAQLINGDRRVAFNRNFGVQKKAR